MKIQSTMIRPPTLDLAIRKYLEKAVGGNVLCPRGSLTVGYYKVDEQYIVVYQLDGKLVFDLGEVQHRGISLDVSSALGSLEKYLRRCEYLKNGGQFVMKYTAYWG